jgi:hypothetical protein
MSVAILVIQTKRLGDAAREIAWENKYGAPP